MSTITKSIGEGHAKGELYAALAHSTSDAFEGMEIKSICTNFTTYDETTGDGRVCFANRNMYVAPYTATQLDIVAPDAIWIMATHIYVCGEVHYAGAEHETSNTEFDVLLTNPTAAANALHGEIDAGLPWATGGRLVGLRGKVNITADGDVGSAAGVWAGLAITSTGVQRYGVHVGLNAEAYSNTINVPNAVVYIQSLPSGSTTDFKDVPYLVFSETVTGEATGSNILFEVGHSWANTIPTKTEGTLFYEDTLQIAVNITAGNRTAYYIPLSTAQGSYTTAYPIVSTQTAAAAIQLGTTGAIQFRDTGLYISSSAADTLDIVSDGSVTLTGKFARTETIAVVDAGTTGRRSYWQFTASSIAAGEQLCGLQLRASWGGTADSDTGGITGIEIKARASSDSITHTVGTAKAIIANVDCKKSTFTTAWGVESQFDIASGGTITTGAAFRASLNNSGTFTTSYAFLVETANTTYPWLYGLYMGDTQATTGIRIGDCTTGILLDGTIVTGLSIATGATTGIAIAAASTAGIAISGANAIGISMTGTYSTAGIYIATDMAAYNDYCIHIAAECDDISGNTILPLYITMNVDGTGGNGRAAEFVLAPTKTMGHWGNAVKAKLDLSGSNGSLGLLAGVCAEVVTPATALAASTACVEHEIVATEGLTLGDFTGAPNTMNFMQFALGGNGTAVTEVDNHGQFMIINGLTALAGNMLSADSTTLKCAVNDSAKYLVMSHAENMLSIGTVGSPIVIDKVLSRLGVYTTIDGSDGSCKATVFDTRLTAGDDLTGTAWIAGVEAFLKVQTGSTVATQGMVTGLRSLFQTAGTVTWDQGHGTAFQAVVMMDSSFESTTADSSISGILIQNNVNAAADIYNGTFYGLRIWSAGTYKDFDYAISVDPSTATTILKVGDCTNLMEFDSVNEAPCEAHYADETSSGRIKIIVGHADRYLYFYD